jgi:hypothetical protein
MFVFKKYDRQNHVDSHRNLTIITLNNMEVSHVEHELLTLSEKLRSHSVCNAICVARL